MEHHYFWRPTNGRQPGWHPSAIIRALFGIDIIPLNAEELRLCREVYTDYLKMPDSAGRWGVIHSRYGKDGWTHATILQGDGGGVTLHRKRYVRPGLLRPHQYGGALRGNQSHWWAGPSVPGEERPSDAELERQHHQRVAYKARGGQ